MKIKKVIVRYYWPNSLVNSKYYYRKGRTWYGLKWVEFVEGYRYFVGNVETDINGKPLLLCEVVSNGNRRSKQNVKCERRWRNSRKPF